MKEIKLTKGKVAFIDDDDYERVSRLKWCALKQGETDLYRACRGFRVNGKSVIQLMHRFIMNVSDPKIKVDHINRNPLDNRKINLRLCHHYENCRNRNKIHKDNLSSKYIGVSFHKGKRKWMARIKVNYKQLFLGYFNSEIDAAKEYDKKAMEINEEFSNINFK